MHNITPFAIPPQGVTIPSSVTPLDVGIKQHLGGMASLEEAYRLGEAAGALRAFNEMKVDGDKSPLYIKLWTDLRIISKLRGVNMALTGAVLSVFQKKISQTSTPRGIEVEFEWATKPGKIDKVKYFPGGFNTVSKPNFFEIESPTKEQHDQIKAWLSENYGDAPPKSAKGMWAVKKTIKRIVHLDSPNNSDVFQPPNQNLVFDGDNHCSILIMVPMGQETVFKLRFSEWFA